MTTKGTFVAFYGIGNETWSEGMGNELCDVARSEGWAARAFDDDGPEALAFVQQHGGPIVAAGHSEGGSDMNNFARDFGSPIAAGLAVDIWFALPMHELYQKVVSVKATRFHAKGPNVVEKIDLPYSHTKVDNSPELQEILRKLLREVSQKEYKSVEKSSDKVEPVNYPDELQKMLDQAAADLKPSAETLAQTTFNFHFFDTIRPMFESISDEAVNGMKVTLYAFEKYVRPRGYDDRLLAFVFGNEFNETGKRMVPLRETGASTHEGAMAALDRWWASGKAQKVGVKSPYWMDGYYGRGPFQYTHKGNYAELSVAWKKWFGFELNFVQYPDLLLNPLVGALSAFIGSAEGFFTGKKLDDFIDATGNVDWAATRAMVNGDRWLVRYDLDNDGKKENMGDEIAGAITVFLEAIENGRTAAAKVATAPVPTAPTQPQTPAHPGALPTREQIQQVPTPDLVEMLLRANDVTDLVLQVLKERSDEIGAIALPTAPETDDTKTANEGIGMIKQVWKLIGGTLGYGMGKLVAASIIPPELADAAAPILAGIITPETVFELLFTGLGVYFAPKNVYPTTIAKS